MATIVIVSEKVMRRIFDEVLPSAAVILVTGTALKDAGVTEERARELAEGYDFGGDADVFVEIVTTTEHYFFSER